jgi:hypothetical protein
MMPLEKAALKPLQTGLFTFTQGAKFLAILLLQKATGRPF